MSQVEHGGNFQDWIKSGSYSFAQMREWLDEYLFPYMKTQDVSDCQTEAVVGGYDNVQQGICFHMVNGGLIWMHIDGNGV